MPALTVAASASLYRAFRPRRARLVAITLGVVSLAALGLLAVFLPPIVGVAGALLDRLAVGLLGAAIAWFCYRQATVRAIPDAAGLTVRNLFLTRRLEWTEIVSVRFGQGRPWVQLDLAGADTVAVMGIQRSDGEYAAAEARRLATLVALREAR